MEHPSRNSADPDSVGSPLASTSSGEPLNSAAFTGFDASHSATPGDCPSGPDEGHLEDSPAHPATTRTVDMATVDAGEVGTSGAGGFPEASTTFTTFTGSQGIDSANRQVTRDAHPPDKPHNPASATTDVWPTQTSPRLDPANTGEGGEAGVPRVSDIQNTTPTLLATDHPKGGEGGEAGVLQLSNVNFAAPMFRDIPPGASVAGCTKVGDPGKGGWIAVAGGVAIEQFPVKNNNYVACSTFWTSPTKPFSAKKERFAALHAILLDDIGTKVPLERVAGVISYLVETSPGNYQGVIILAEPIRDVNVADRLLKAVIAAGLSDTGATGVNRWIRLPLGINGKPKHRDSHGNAFRCRLAASHPDRCLTLPEIVARLDLDFSPTAEPAPVKQVKAVNGARDSAGSDDIVLYRAGENKVIAALKEFGLYKKSLGPGKHDITCPWVDEHTDGLDGGTAYFEPSSISAIGGFRCQHAHGSELHIHDLLSFLRLASCEARNLDLIRIRPGRMDVITDAAEELLAAGGLHYQAGGLIAIIAVDHATGDPAVVPINVNALTRDLSAIVEWEKYDARKGSWIPADPPPRHVQILYDAQTFRHLPILVGVARQPYFCESDGRLLFEPGYDAAAQRFGVFNPLDFPMPDPTPDAARQCLTLLEDLLVEFSFANPFDRSAALAAILTAVTRPALAHAPAFHVQAPIYGSGKTYLCELIGLFAGPAGNAKLSYPTTSEEATKAMLSILIKGPASVEFDDMDTDWIPHGTIKRMLTADSITDRILGYSKTATVSTRVLFLGSGNNVGPVRDLLRRVLTIHLDPRSATPATRSYKGSPVERVRKMRGKYVAAALTIIRAWHEAGSPRSVIGSIATFGGTWTDYCRQPLVWLGHPDPATSLFEQISRDPDAEKLLGLLKAWKVCFGSTPTTVRKACTGYGPDHDELNDAMCEFPIVERGEINRSKLGWFLKKNANRIVDGLEFRESRADGRVAWQVVGDESPASKESLLPVKPPTADSDNFSL